MSCNVYYENKKVNIEWKHHVLKIFDCGNINLILTLKNQLLLIKRDDNSNNLTKLRDNVIDASYSYPLFYIVDSDGRVFKTNIEQINDNRFDEIIVEQKIIQISGNGDGLLMVNYNHELLGMGNFENILCSDEPKKIECFSNIKALQIATGDNFALVLVLPLRPQSPQNSMSVNHKTFLEKVKYDGRDLLKTQVWSFGSINKGLLGSGDHVKKKDFTVIIKLVDIGVYRIHCGSHHAAALTLDGKLFLWGFNNHQQISIDPTIQDISSPIEFKSEINGKPSKNILAVTTSSSNTVILFNDLSFKILGKNGNSLDDNEEFASNLKYEYDAGNIEDNEGVYSVPYIISHNKVLLVNQKNISMFLLTYLTEEQRNVRAMIYVYQKYMNIIRNTDDDTRKLTELFENLLYISIANLQKTVELLQSDCEQKLESTIINVHFTDVMREYQRYLKQFCDIISFYSIHHYEKRIDKKIITIVLEKPFVCLEIYEKLLDLIYDLHLYNNNPNISIDNEIEELKRQTVERKKIIEDFRKVIVTQKMKEAQDTFTFWQTLNDSAIKQELHQKERRFIMDSMTVPLKVHDRSTIFGKQRFILFNDYLAYSLARTEFIPIHLVWIQAFSTTSSNKFSFKIITPENVLKVYTLTSQDKVDWQKNIRECIWHSLRKNPSIVNQGLPISRYGCYKFTERNAKYPNYEVDGKWFEGKFTELCHIKNPAISRLFRCRITNSSGDLNGHGIIEDHTFKYHGEFQQGKLHGYGTWKSKLKTIFYQGFIKNDKFHGYGVMSQDDVTYYGEFVNNVKNGYGIEDDIISGNKYIGMWQDGKRHGAGILITIDGSYFEGIFANNQLSGDGLAIFPNGSYYIGELNIDGANGYGSFHIPETEIIEEIMELDDSNMKMKGNILKGTLSGTWDKFQVTNGTMSMGEIFLRTPNSSSYLKIKADRKWATFFDNWCEEVFGTWPEKISLQERWYRVSSFISRRKSFENDMKTNFMLVNEEISDSEYNEMQFVLPTEPDKMIIPSISRSNSEVYLKASASDDFETSSLRTLSDYSISSIAAPKKSRISALDFDFVPSFYNSTFTTTESIEELKVYLNSSIDDIYHPFYLLVNELRKAFCACYGNWRSKPISILSKIATNEWITLMKKIYSIFRLLFPHLPQCESPDSESDEEYDVNVDCKLLAPLNFMHQLLLNDEIYSCFFLLYASKNSRQDELYAHRLMTCEKKSNEELRQLLKIEPNLVPLLEDDEFYQAIESFKKLSQMFCPSKMLQIIKDTFEIINKCANKLSNDGVMLSADNLLSITIYLIVKASINHLGAELSLLTDLMENDIEKLINMEQYIYTTVKIGYLHTISTRFFHN